MDYEINTIDLSPEIVTENLLCSQHCDVFMYILTMMVNSHFDSKWACFNG